MTKRWSGEKREGDRQLWMKKETGEPDILVVKKGIVGILKESCKKRARRQASFQGEIRTFINGRTIPPSLGIVKTSSK